MTEDAQRLAQPTRQLCRTARMWSIGGGEHAPPHPTRLIGAMESRPNQMCQDRSGCAEDAPRA